MLCLCWENHSYEKWEIWQILKRNISSRRSLRTTFQKLTKIILIPISAFSSVFDPEFEEQILIINLQFSIIKSSLHHSSWRISNQSSKVKSIKASCCIPNDLEVTDIAQFCQMRKLTSETRICFEGNPYSGPWERPWLSNHNIILDRHPIMSDDGNTNNISIRQVIFNLTPDDFFQS
jgi:hypothetical protein